MSMHGPRHIAILVEGQTEEAFVNRVLQPLVGFSTAYLTPIIVHTSRAADGRARRGGGQWSHYRAQLSDLLSQPHWAMVTTMIDFYAYPGDAPSCACQRDHRQPDCVDERELAIRGVFDDERLVPFIMLHEFETLVIAAGSSMPDVFGDPRTARLFAKLVEEHHGNAEMIDNGPTTAPSKRVKIAVKDYDKVIDGVAILSEGLTGGLERTPRFTAWIERLRAG